MQAFAKRVRVLFPLCPPGREQEIARHSCRKYSGRGGRTAAAGHLDEGAIRLAAIAHVRHAESDYDAILALTGDRRDARARVDGRVRATLAHWERTG